MLLAINSRTSGKFNRETINGRSHIVTTMIPIVGDVAMNGINYPDDQVAESFMQLNMLPAPNGHPKINGVYVPAFHPVANNAQNFGGFIRNPRKNGKQVQVDFVLDEVIANLTDDGQELIKRIENSESVGVSTGLSIGQLVEKSGTDDFGQKFVREGSHFNFDHVAILLHEKAAGEHAGTELKLNTADKDEPIFVVNLSIDEHGHGDGITDGDDPVSHDRRSTDKTEFITTTNNEDDDMNKELLVLAIIGNSFNAFTSKDKEHLMDLSESSLVDALCVNVDKDRATQVLTDLGFDFVAFEDFQVNKESFEQFKADEKERLDEIRESITTNSDYTPEMVEDKTEAELLVINKMIEGSKSPKRIAQGKTVANSQAGSNADLDYSM